MLETEVVVEEEVKKPEDAGVEVDLTEKKPEVKPDAETQLQDRIKVEVEKELQVRIKPFINQAEQARRQADQYRTQLEQASKKSPPAEQTQDELDKLVDSGNWKEAVSRLADQRAVAIIQQREQQTRIEQDALSRRQLLDSSIRKVTELYPELDEHAGDPNAEVSKAFSRLMNANPDLLSNPRGPELVMYEMEREMIADKQTPRSWQVKAASTSNHVPGRASTTTLAPSRPSISSNKVVLTREQKEFCDRQGIKVEDYARIARTLESTGGVEA